MNSIDKIFRSKLSHHTLETPDDAWTNIASRLPDQKKKFSPWWMIVSILAIVSSSVATFLYFKKDMLMQEMNSPVQISDQEFIATNYHEQQEGTLIAELSKYEPTFDRNNAGNDNGLKFSKSGFSKNTESLILNSSSNLEFFNQPEKTSFEINTPLINKIYFRPISNFLKFEIQNMKGNLNYGNSPIGKDHSICPTMEIQKKKLSLELFVSHDYAPKILKPLSEDMLPYAAIRMETEKASYSFSAGLRFNYQLSDKWSVLSGLNYSQINERFNYIDPESNQTREITIKDYIYQNGKIVDSIINKQTVIIPGETKLSVKNKYSSVDIPVLGRFRVIDNSHINISGIAGIYLNVSSVTKGMAFDSDNISILDISNNSGIGKEIFKNYLGISPYIGLNVSYHINPSVDFFAEPHARFQTSSITKADYPLTQRYNTYGLTTGVKYNF